MQKSNAKMLYNYRHTLKITAGNQLWHVDCTIQLHANYVLKAMHQFTVLSPTDRSVTALTAKSIVL